MLGLSSIFHHRSSISHQLREYSEKIQPYHHLVINVHHTLAFIFIACIAQCNPCLRLRVHNYRIVGDSVLLIFNCKYNQVVKRHKKVKEVAIAILDSH
jgi:hypothetical protein